MYRKSVEWRRQKGVDHILKWKSPEVLRKYYPGGFAGFDREGCPVWIIPFGHADVKGYLMEFYTESHILIAQGCLLVLARRSLWTSL